MPRKAEQKFSKVYRRTQPAASRNLQRAYVMTSSRPRTYAVRGRGGYWQNVKSRWAEGGGPRKGLFEQAGNILGGPIGGQAGGLINRALYALTGFGDYTVKKNVLLEETNGPPAVINRSNKEFVVRHREYIQDIYANTAPVANSPSNFGVLSYPINPGSAVTFPWLSTIADKFEQYRIEGMVFEYKSLYSDAVVTLNGSIGSVILATEYNAGAPTFASKQAMENYQFAQSAKPSCSILHPIECANRQNVLSELYIRPGSVPDGEDVKTYDFGDFQIASQGIPVQVAASPPVLGELWVSYQIALLKPRIPTTGSVYKDSGFAYFTGYGNNSSRLPYGTIPVPIEYTQKVGISNIPIRLVADNTFQIDCASTEMTYQFNLEWYSANNSAAAAWRAPSASLINATFVNSSATGPYQNVLVPTGSTQIGNSCSSTYLVKVPAATPALKVSQITISSATFGCDQGNSVRFEMYVNAVPTPLV